MHAVCVCVCVCVCVYMCVTHTCTFTQVFTMFFQSQQILSFEDEFPGMVKFVNTRFPIAEFIGLGMFWMCV